MITSVGEFTQYFEGVRRRTLAAVARVTPALAGYRPRPEEWACGQIVQHIAGAERFFVTKVAEGPTAAGSARGGSSWRWSSTRSTTGASSTPGSPWPGRRPRRSTGTRWNRSSRGWERHDER